MKILPSGINGLDTVLNGGFNHPSTVLIAGTAGAGKTTFVMQSLVNAAKAGETCLFISAISEPVAMMETFISNYSFFDYSLIETKKIRLFNIEKDLLQASAPEVIRFIEEKISMYKPTWLIIDPVTVIAESRPNELDRRLFLFELLTRMKSWNLLVLLTGEFSLESLKKSPLSYLVDGILYISEETTGEKSERYLSIIKMRGRKYVSGRHTYNISGDGITVFPRLLPPAEPKKEASTQRISTGVEGLDAMLKGGLLKEDVILFSGGPGSGKTIFGLHFIYEGAARGEPGLIISLEEWPSKLKRNAKTFGWDFELLEKKGLVTFLYFPPALFHADEHAILIKEILEKNKIKRVFFDGIEDLVTPMPDVIKRRDYVHSLIDYFSSQDITTLMTNEIPEMFGNIRTTLETLSGSVDTVILLRQVEVEGHLRKALSILKSRGSDHDKEIREFEITGRGIEVKVAIKGYDNVLAGMARKQPSDVFMEMFGGKKP
ncbi:MAG: ATPase domain-containing protein [Candidatus Methanoperedens sp.]|nr:ATPase domain-containing protein [Candidatus Methanoperedens sp.]